MYAEPYGLRENPFSLNIDPRYFWMSSPHQEVVATLVYALEQREGWALILGGAGMGKTASLAGLLRQLSETAVPVVASCQGVTSVLDIYNRLALQMGETEGPYQSKTLFLGDLRKQIQACRLEGKTLLLVLDDAQLLDPDILEEVSLLGAADDQSPRVLHIFLVARPELAYALDHSGLADLKQRLKRACRLESLDRQETAMYVRHRLKTAGGEETLFDDQALDAIYDASLGVPRRVNLMAALALKSGLKDDAAQIGRPQALAAVERARGVGGELDEALTAAHPALPPEDQSCPLGVPLPVLTEGERAFEEKIEATRNQLYRGMKWWQRTVKLTVEWDRMRRRRLGLLATSFPNFCSRWDLPHWDDFNEARRQADQAGASYEDWLKRQFQRVVGEGFGRISPADLHGREARRFFQDARAEEERLKQPVPSVPSPAEEVSDAAYERRTRELLDELLDLSQYICDGRTQKSDDLLAEAVCQAVLPMGALAGRPAVRAKVEQRLTARANQPTLAPPSVII